MQLIFFRSFQMKCEAMHYKCSALGCTVTEPSLDLLRCIDRTRTHMNAVHMEHMELPMIGFGRQTRHMSNNL